MLNRALYGVLSCPCGAPPPPVGPFEPCGTCNCCCRLLLLACSVKRSCSSRLCSASVALNLTVTAKMFLRSQKGIANREHLPIYIYIYICFCSCSTSAHGIVIVLCNEGSESPGQLGTTVLNKLRALNLSSAVYTILKFVYRTISKAQTVP